VLIFTGIDALLLFWYATSTQARQILVLLAIILAVIFLVRILYRVHTSFRIWRLHMDLGSFLSLGEIKSAVRYPFSRSCFLPGEGRVVNLRSYLLGKLASSPLSGSNYYLLLGPVGGGKTQFLVQLYHQLKWFSFARRSVFLCSLAEKGGLDQLAFVPVNHRDILLLDGLDEDPLALQDFVKRMDEVLALCQGFKKVVLACEHRWFPQLKEELSEQITYVGEECLQQFEVCEMIPFQDWESRKNLKKEMGVIPIAIRKQLEQWPDLIDTPFWLKVLPHTHLPEPAQYQFEVFKRHIDYVLAYLMPEEEKQQAIHRFLEGVAGSIHQQWLNGREQLLEEAEMKALANAFGLSTNEAQHFFLAKVNQRFYRFRHRIYLAYFLAQAAFREELKPEATNFLGLPMASTFFLEMAWLYYQEQTQESEGFFRSILNQEKRPFAALNSMELPTISYLYLQEYRDKDLRFLRALKHLKAIHLSGASARDLEADWRDEIPHEEVLLYLGWNPNHQHIWLPDKQEHLVRLPHDQVTTVYKRKFREINLGQEINPFIRIAPGLRNRVQKGRKRVLNLFHLDLTDLPNANCELMGSRTNAQGEKMTAYEMHLGMLELDLFNRAEIYVFEDGSYNLLLQHEYKPTLMVEAIRDAVGFLYRTYGEDDFHRTLFDEDDEVQIQDGIWLGRRWSWQNTDSYAYPLHLYMNQPDKVCLVICGLKTVSRPQVQS
jgi:hypothetical protein